MNYQETIDYLFQRLPMFQRVGAAAYKADLNNTLQLCELLGHPEQKFRSIHVAGTNGKGSTSHLLAAIYQAAGYKVGLYTSPHLKDFRERIKINGELISEKEVVDFVAKYRFDFEKIDLSFFEMTVGLAFDYFSKQAVDIAIVEVGLGGRLDSTNVILPELSVITNISFDHVHLLGDSLPRIAAEKAGIIKPNVPVVIGETQAETMQVFLDRATNSPISFADEYWTLVSADTRMLENKLVSVFSITGSGDEHFTDLIVGLPGWYQRKNALTVLESIRQLQSKFPVSEKAIRDGMARVVDTTGLMGRWQVLAQHPLVITDTGHNEAGIKLIVEQLAATPHQNLHLVLGMVNDKDVSAVLQLLPSSARYYFCKANIPRALPAEELMNQAAVFGLKGEAFSTVSAALSAAKANAKADDLIFVGGSTFVAAEVV